jgi:hypothetical protein
MQAPENRLGKPMKRIAIWAFYGVGALAIGYLALFAYAMFTGRDLQPGDPIHIFRKPDAPSYSWGDRTILASLRAKRSNPETK